MDRLNRAPERIENPSLTIGLAVQPETLRGVLSKRVMRGRGLLARFLFAVPPNMIGSRDPDPPLVSQPVVERYHENLRQLLDLGFGGDTGEDRDIRVMEFDAEGMDILVELQSEIESRMGKHGDLVSIQDWAGKLPGAIVRIAGILHLAEHVDESEPWTHPITAATLRKARTIGTSYLPSHAFAAFGEMGVDPVIDDAKRMLRWIKDEGTPTCSKRDMFNGLRGQFSKVIAMDPALEVLKAHGYLVELPPEVRSGPGRKKSQAYQVNPWLLTQNPQNSRIADDVIIVAGQDRKGETLMQLN